MKVNVNRIDEDYLAERMNRQHLFNDHGNSKPSQERCSQAMRWLASTPGALPSVVAKLVHKLFGAGPSEREGSRRRACS